MRNTRVMRPPVINYKLDNVQGLSYFKNEKPYTRGELRVETNEGAIRTIALRPQAVADFYQEYLEALASHRGSVLGGVPGQAQPSQKAFDTLLWNALRRFDPGRMVFVESESAKVGTPQPSTAVSSRSSGRPAAAATILRSSCWSGCPGSR